MNVEEFIRGLRREVLSDGMEFYQDFFENKSGFEEGDSYWRDATTFYASLDENQRAIFLRIVRQVSIDTIANILGIIDGVCYFEGVTGDFSLKEPDGRELAGDLQEHFFMQEQDPTDQ